jgi:acetyl esterase
MRHWSTRFATICLVAAMTSAIVAASQGGQPLSGGKPSVVREDAGGGVAPAAGRDGAAIKEKLDAMLRQFPEADANKDGVLTIDEAKAFRKAGKKDKTSPKTDAGGKTPPPTQADVSYGPHARDTLDFWRAASDRPTPVLIFFHGGSFKAGDKSMVLSRPVFEECLKAGISVVSANYRFSSDAPFPAPMHDGARAVQFVRSMAKQWNIDPARLAVSGSSAGATLALWIALHDDLANPASKDPVSRLSTRVTCANPHSGTAGLEPEYFKKQAGVSKLGAAICQLFGAASQAELESPEKRALVREASPLLHATPDDPPLFLTYAGDPSEAPFTADSAQKAWIHHVCLGLPLKARYDALGLECELYHASKPPSAGAEIAFLKKHLLGGAKATAP